MGSGAWFQDLHRLHDMVCWLRNIHLAGKSGSLFQATVLRKLADRLLCWKVVRGGNSQASLW